MATIRKQKVGKYTYWQIIESRRVDGKPRPFVLLHLGTAEQLLYKLTQGPLQRKIHSVSHGAVHLFFRAAEELDLLALFQRVFSSQIRDGVSVGLSLLLAAIHRAVHPDSKRAFAEWAKQTSLPELFAFEPDNLDSQHFWEQMDTVTDAQLEQAEKEMTLQLVEKNLLSSRLLFYDLTNFFTYIDSTNSRSELTQRGRNKQKRNDLRQYGLSQAVTQEFLIPVLSEIYEGNETDRERFLPFLTKVRTRLAEVQLSLQEFTLVFDKGSNTKENFAALDQSELPYVASLTSAYHEDLIGVPLSDYRKVTVSGKEISCYRTRKKVWGKARTIVIAVSEAFRAGQIRGLDQALTKKQEELDELQAKLHAPRAKKYTRDKLQQKVDQLVKGEKCPLILKVLVLDTEGGGLDLTWQIDQASYEWVTKEFYGKRILVTCRDEWSDEEIIAAYHGQSQVERVFKQLKNPHHHAVRPQYHWTDQKIKVHTFLCLVGLLLSQIIGKKAKALGYEMEIETLIDQLSEIRMAEVITFHSLKAKPVKETQLEEVDPALQKLYNALLEKGI